MYIYIFDYLRVTFLESSVELFSYFYLLIRHTFVYHIGIMLCITDYSDIILFIICFNQKNSSIHSMMYTVRQYVPLILVLVQCLFLRGLHQRKQLHMYVDICFLVCIFKSMKTISLTIHFIIKLPFVKSTHMDPRKDFHCFVFFLLFANQKTFFSFPVFFIYVCACVRFHHYFALQ